MNSENSNVNSVPEVELKAGCPLGQESQESQDWSVKIRVFQRGQDKC